MTAQTKTAAAKKVACDKVATQNLLCGLYKNVTMSKNAIKTLLCKVDDEELHRTLFAEIEKYDEFCKKAETLADNVGVKISPVSSALLNMAKMGIKMKTMGGSDKVAIVKILLNGTFMGVIEITETISGAKNVHSEAVLLAKEIKCYEEEKIEKLKNLL